MLCTVFWPIVRVCSPIGQVNLWHAWQQQLLLSDEGMTCRQGVCDQHVISEIWVHAYVHVTSMWLVWYEYKHICMWPACDWYVCTPTHIHTYIHTYVHVWVHGTHTHTNFSMYGNVPIMPSKSMTDSMWCACDKHVMCMWHSQHVTSMWLACDHSPVHTRQTRISVTVGRPHRIHPRNFLFELQ